MAGELTSRALSMGRALVQGVGGGLLTNAIIINGAPITINSEQITITKAV